MSTSKTKTEQCPLEAIFVGGTFDGETFWIDEPSPQLIKCVLEKPDNLGVVYKADSIYKLISKGPPLKYQNVQI